MRILPGIIVGRDEERPLPSRPRRWRLAVMVAALLGGVVPAGGQEPGPDSSLTAPGAAVVEDAAAPEGLPAADNSLLPPPATDRAYLHVFLAFGIAWALILGYAVLLNRRIAAAERDLARLGDRRA